MAYTKDKSIRYGARVLGSNSESLTYKNLTQVSSVKVLTRQRTGVGLPKYKDVISSGGNATTPLSGTFSSLEASRNSASLTFIRIATGARVVQKSWGDFAAHATGAPTWGGGWSSNAGARAAAGYFQDVRKAQVAVSGPTFLGELRETIRMLRKPGAALWDSIGRYLDDVSRANRDNKRRYFNKKKAKYGRNLSKIASGLWLEHAFGWVPLMMDIADAGKALDSLLEPERIMKVSAGGHDAKLVSNISGTSTMHPPDSFLYFTVRGKQMEHVVVRIRAAVKAQAAATYADKMARFGFTPSEFIPTAWELLPWSFLLDYFANIGDILASTFTDTSSVIWTAKSEIHKVVKYQLFQLDTSRINSTVGGAKYVELLTGSPGYVKWTISTMSRTANPPVDIPALSWSLPGSAKRLFNCAALMEQVGISLHGQRPSRRNYRL